MKQNKKNLLIERYNNPVDETTIYDPLALVTRARGSYIWIKGKKQPYLDLLMSYSSTNFGHVNAKILTFVKHAMVKFDNIIGFNSDAKIQLSKKLVDLLPYSGNKISYFPVGGTKAIDAAIKLAKAYTQKDTIIAFDGAFHGYSFGAMSVTDEGYIEKKQFGSSIGKVKTFPFPHRLMPNANNSAAKILTDIEAFIKANKKQVAAILFEPIQGAAGFIIPPPNFLKNLIALGKKYHVITICDEIQTGVYRTGTFYYINQPNVDPDIILLSKSLAGGYYPLSAVIANKELYEAVDNKHSGFDSTFATNVFGIEIANDVISYGQKTNIAKLVQTTGNAITQELRLLLLKFSFIKDFDSIGMAYAYRIEAPSGDIKESAALAKRIKKIAFDNHLIIQTAGVHGEHMKMAPNFFITKNEIRKMIERLSRTFDSIQRSLHN